MTGVQTCALPIYPFKGHAVGDVQNPDYVCSIDVQNSELRPSFISNSTEFQPDYANSSYGTSYSNTIVSLRSSEVPVITQGLASGSVALNPFLFTNFIGTIKLSPAGDTWVDQNQRPDVLVNLQGNNDAWETIGQALNDSRAPGWGVQWNDWQTISQGVVGTETQTFDQSSTQIGRAHV